MNKNFNFEDTIQFLKALSLDGDDQSFVFQTFDENKSGDNKHRSTLTRVISGTFSQVKEQLKSLNEKGAGIFVTINRSLNGKRTEKDISSLRALFIDKDDGNIPEFPLKPSLVVQSRRGQHAYFLLKSEEILAQFSKAQKHLASFYSSDPKVCDLPRVMRLPGFFHQKDPSNPFLVTIVENYSVRYTIDEILASHQIFKTELQYKDNLDSFISWTNRLPTDESSKNKYGGRNNTCVYLAREGLARKVKEEDLRRIGHDYCVKSKLEPDVFQEILNRQILQHAEMPFSPSTVAGKENGISAFELAKEYLNTKCS